VTRHRHQVSLSEAGRLLKKHRSTIRSWVEAGAPSAGEGLVDLGELLTWREAQAREAEAAKWREKLEAAERLAGMVNPGEDDLPIQEWTRRKRAAEARLRELEVAEREGELIPGADGERIVVGLATAARQRMLAIPDKTALQHAAAGDSPKAHRDISASAIHEALEELAAAGDAAERRLEDKE